MIRRAAVLVLALTVNQALLHAEDTVLTVNVPSADVYKGPSNVTPIVGHVSEGTVLAVSRNLGSWVKVAWHGTPDGVGYLRATMGRLDTLTTSPVRRVPSFSGPVTRTIPLGGRTSAGEVVVPRSE